MACPKKPCSNTYSNYGSYLRTRGCESAICRLLEDIKSGIIPIGPINPSVPCNLGISANVTIDPCTDGDQSSGKLIVNGGHVTPCSPSTTPVIQSVEAQNYSITAGNGLYVEGPIFADATSACSHNTFIAENTLFTGNLNNTDPHNVTITGSSIIGSEITNDGEPILTCGDDTLFNVNFASASEDLILDIDSKKCKVYKSNSIPNSADDEEPILRINKNCTVYNSLSTPMLNIDDGERKIFEVISNLNADVTGDSMPGFVVKESNIDFVNRANIYMNHLPKVEPSSLYPRVVVHPGTGRLYKEEQYFPDTYIIDTLTVNDDLKVGSEFEVTPSTDESDSLLIKMNNLPLNDDSIIEFLLMVNSDGTISRSLKNNLFENIDTAIMGIAIIDNATIETATIDTLMITDTGDFKIGDEFEVTPSSSNSDNLLVKMENLPSPTLIDSHKVLVINEKGVVEKSSQDSLFSSLLAKIEALEARISDLEHSG